MLQNKITPSKALLIRPMSCEKQAAYVHNSAVDEAAKEDIGRVAYRYVQSSQGERNTRTEAIVCGIAGLCFLILYVSEVFLSNEKANNDDLSNNRTILNYALTLIPILIVPALWLNVLPNLANSLNYNATKNQGKDWLIARQGPSFFNKLKVLPYSQFGKERLLALLKEDSIDASSIEKKCTTSGSA
ncbi:MAG: hypothetical protein Q8M03_15930 [Legionella sp.]|nr:hypothetical protein [Legionella sp.]